MPLVNGKHYPYTAAGKKAAEAARKSSPGQAKKKKVEEPVTPKAAPKGQSTRNWSAQGQAHASPRATAAKPMAVAPVAKKTMKKKVV